MRTIKPDYRATKYTWIRYHNVQFKEYAKEVGEGID